LLAAAALLVAGVTAFAGLDGSLGDRLSMAVGSAGASPCAWAGAWETDKGMVIVSQTATGITARYGYDGNLTGTVSGSTLAGTWTLGTASGRFQFTISPVCYTFAGTWGYGTDATAEPWTGYSVTYDHTGWARSTPTVPQARCASGSTWTGSWTGMYTSAAGKMAGAPLFIDDSSGLSILQLRAKARRMHQQYGIKLFVIDYLQLLHSTARKAENRQQEIADISNGVKALAKELRVPVIVLSQLNREMERDKNRQPRMSDLRESGAIEQDADLVAMLYRPDTKSDDEGGGASPEPTDGVPVQLLIAKQRNGPTGEVPLVFLKGYTRFESRAPIGAGDVPT